MAANPLRAAGRQGLRDDRWLKTAFGRYLGSAKKPRGGVLSAYRKARKDMKRALAGTSNDTPNEVLRVLRQQLTGIAFEAVSGASAQGVESGIVQVDAYTDVGEQIFTTGQQVDTGAFINSWMATYASQEEQVRGLLAAGGDAGKIIGGDDRMGVLAPGVMLEAGTKWIATALNTQVAASFGEPVGDGWGKQALPNIDDVTTDCCLFVAGQIQPIDGKFYTPADPHYSLYQDWSPFHWNCRTSVVLYKKGFDDGVTVAIRESANEQKATNEAEERAKRKGGG